MDRTTERFLQRSFQPDDRLAIVALDRGEKPLPAIQLFTRARNIGPLMGLLEEYNKTRDLYCSVNPLAEGTTSRTKEDVGTVRHIFADFDVDASKRIAEMIQSKRVPRPNETITTSPGKAQVLWRVSGFSKDQAESLSRGLVREFGADPAATDVNRVMRLPGLHNRKYDPAPYVGVQRISAAVSRPEQFPVYSEDRQHGPVRGYERGANAPGGISRSERDWAWVREALKHNVAPSEIKARLAEMRLDKPNPGYYADRTVRNAMERSR